MPNIFIAFFTYCLFISLNEKCLSYHKPDHTSKVILPSYNTTTEPSQSWSTNVKRDNMMILGIQSNGNDTLLEGSSLKIKYCGSTLFKWRDRLFKFVFYFRLCMVWVFDERWLYKKNSFFLKRPLFNKNDFVIPHAFRFVREIPPPSP